MNSNNGGRPVGMDFKDEMSDISIKAYDQFVKQHEEGYKLLNKKLNEKFQEQIIFGTSGELTEEELNEIKEMFKDGNNTEV